MHQSTFHQLRQIGHLNGDMAVDCGNKMAEN